MVLSQNLCLWPATTLVIVEYPFAEGAASSIAAADAASACALKSVGAAVDVQENALDEKLGMIHSVEERCCERCHSSLASVFLLLVIEEVSENVHSWQFPPKLDDAGRHEHMAYSYPADAGVPEV